MDPPLPENPYAPPRASLEDVAPPVALARRSVLLVFVLSVLTLTLYLLYWYVSVTRVLNALVPQKRISVAFMAFCVLLTLGSLGVNVVLGALEGSGQTAHQLAEGERLLSALDIFMTLIWSLRLREQLNALSGARRGGELWVKVLWTWLLQPLYLQYKINQLLRAPGEARQDETLRGKMELEPRA